MNHLRLKLREKGSGKRAMLHQTTDWLRVEEIYVQFGPRVCLLAAFAIVPLLAQIFRKRQLPRSPFWESVKERELALPTFAYPRLRQPSALG